MNPLPSPGVYCPLCRGVSRVSIRLLNGDEGLYCSSCKYIEVVGRGPGYPGIYQ
ncbi:MAG: hypothetical protein RQ758_04455 [Methanomicrobiaceae archaeon]|nr:hypothetical protein [Methanomicrobiaceae archaeon]